MSAETNEVLKAPFPWFGGKSDVAGEVWQRFGVVRGYIEPFFGTGAVLLGRPQPFDGVETVNDKDGLVCNFWRAVQSAPEEVAKWADWPINECDLTARHFWLVERKETLQAKLEGDPDYFDAKIAGWWCWGICCWIGSGWCSGDGPWGVQEIDGQRQLVHLSSAGMGVNRKRVHLGNAGMGVNRQLVHLGNAGRGVNCKRVENGVYDWMNQLSERLKRVRVCCGDWKRVTGGNNGDSLKHFFAGGNTCAVFLDPPYSAEAGRNETLYRKESLDVAHSVREWAISQGNDPRLRIALCGYAGEHNMPDDWQVLEWKTKGGYAAVADDETSGKANRHRERIWFSPHCLSPDQCQLL